MTEERFNYYATKALNEFKANYPHATSADLQTFTLGLQEGFKIGIYGDVEEDYAEENKIIDYPITITNSREDEQFLNWEKHYKTGEGINKPNETLAY